MVKKYTYRSFSIVKTTAVSFLFIPFSQELRQRNCNRRDCSATPSLLNVETPKGNIADRCSPLQSSIPPSYMVLGWHNFNICAGGISANKISFSNKLPSYLNILDEPLLSKAILWLGHRLTGKYTLFGLLLKIMARRNNLFDPHGI